MLNEKWNYSVCLNHLKSLRVALNGLSGRGILSHSEHPLIPILDVIKKIIKSSLETVFFIEKLKNEMQQKSQDEEDEETKIIKHEIMVRYHSPLVSCVITTFKGCNRALKLKSRAVDDVLRSTT